VDILTETDTQRNGIEQRIGEESEKNKELTVIRQSLIELRAAAGLKDESEQQSGGNGDGGQRTAALILESISAKDWQVKEQAEALAGVSSLLGLGQAEWAQSAQTEMVTAVKRLQQENTDVHQSQIALESVLGLSHDESQPHCSRGQSILSAIQLLQENSASILNETRKEKERIALQYQNSASSLSSLVGLQESDSDAPSQIEAVASQMKLFLDENADLQQSLSAF
jgi:hypothetical protein